MKKRSTANRNYKLEYARDQSSTKRKKYRAALTRFRRKNKGGAGKDAIHKGSKITGYGSRKANRQDGARKATRARVRRSK